MSSKSQTDVEKEVTVYSQVQICFTRAESTTFEVASSSTATLNLVLFFLLPLHFTAFG